MTIPPLVLKKSFNAPVEKVFEAWSNPEIMKLWFKPNAKWQTKTNNTFKIGGSYNHAMISEDGNTSYDHFGEYKEIVPNQKIFFTWSSQAVQNTLVTVELEEVNGRTNLTLTHNLFPTEEEKGKHNQGWEECLKNLENHFSQ
jgi:uncharacterized protein YndB with AHSA1/START domain